MSITLNPTPGFVVKTRVISSHRHPPTTKVFLNLCHDPQVPKPSDFDPAVVFPLIIENQWEVPLIVSQERRTTDKKGIESLVYDCCMNSTCFQWIQLNADLRAIVIEWSIEAVEMAYSQVLERDFTQPKMLSKGELEHIEVSREDMEAGVQNKLQEMKDHEISALVASDNESDSLPDIMDIKGEYRPIIEELQDLKIEKTKGSQDNRRSITSDEKTAPNDILENTITTSNIHNSIDTTTSSGIQKSINMDTCIPKDSRIDFSLTFTKVSSGVIVRVYLPQFESGDAFRLEQGSEEMHLFVNGNYCWSKDCRVLQIPVKGERAFAEFVKAERALYLLVEKTH